MNPLTIAGRTVTSRLLLGTGKFSSYQVMREAIIASGASLVTVALKRLDVRSSDDSFLEALRIPNVTLVPNTSGARTATEAVFAARLAREALGTDWVKLEIHPDPRYLLPDPIETLAAATELVKDGFIVLPYINADPVLCKRLVDVGVQAVMPLGAPIGSNRGLLTQSMLEIIIEESTVPVIVDAGIGAPWHAAQAIHLGADAVLVNTAIAAAGDPVVMARAFSIAVEAGQMGRSAVPAPLVGGASSSSPLTAFLN
jgi:thiazole synthase